MQPDSPLFISTNKANPNAYSIKPDTTIYEVVQEHPETAGIFERWGLNPEQQTALRYESLSATCLVRHIDCQDLLAELETVL
jgi:hypothetical protein